MKTIKVYSEVPVMLVKRREEADYVLKIEKNSDVSCKEDYNLIVYEFLQQIKMVTSNLGYKYIKYALVEMIKDQEKANLWKENITKVFYPYLAEQFSTTCSRVERAIRHQLELVMKDYNVSIFIEQICGGKVTNSSFLSGSAEYLKMKK